MPSSGRACVHAATAAPKPNHAGSIRRHCAHPNTQGIARRSSTRIDFLREAGRLPMCRLAISAITVESQKYRSKSGRFIHQRAVGPVGVGGKLLHRRHELGTRRPVLRVQQRHLQHAGDDVIEVLPAEFRIEIFSGNDLALFGDADARLHGARGLRQDRLVARAAAATDRPAAAVKYPQLDAAALEHIDQRHLGLVELPARRQKAAVLVAVGIAEHDLLHAARGCAGAAHRRGWRGARPSPRRSCADRRSSRTAARC